MSKPLSVAHYLISRKLCKFEEIWDLIRAGDVTVRTLIAALPARTVTNPNEPLVITPQWPVELSVKNRAKTTIYAPWFDGKFIKAVRYDYGSHVWEVVERANAIVAVPVLDGDKIVLAKVYRPAIAETLYELPAGMMEPWESAHDTALRELEEETGYTAGRIDTLWSAFSSPGFCTEEAHFYLCTDLTPGAQHLDAEEQIEPFIVPITKAFDLVRCGKIRDMKTIAAISFLTNFMGDNPCQLSPWAAKSVTSATQTELSKSLN